MLVREEGETDEREKKKMFLSKLLGRSHRKRMRVVKETSAQT